MPTVSTSRQCLWKCISLQWKRDRVRQCWKQTQFNVCSFEPVLLTEKRKAACFKKARQVCERNVVRSSYTHFFFDQALPGTIKQIAIMAAIDYRSVTVYGSTQAVFRPYLRRNARPASEHIFLIRAFFTSSASALAFYAAVKQIPFARVVLRKYFDLVSMFYPPPEILLSCQPSREKAEKSRTHQKNVRWMVRW